MHPKPVLSEALSALSTELDRLGGRLAVISGEATQADIDALVFQEMVAPKDAAVKAIKAVLAWREEVGNARSRRKLDDIEDRIEGVLSHLHSLSEGLVSLENVPEDPLPRRALLLMASNLFSADVAYFHKQAQHYGREEVAYSVSIQAAKALPAEKMPEAPRPGRFIEKNNRFLNSIGAAQGATLKAKTKAKAKAKAKGPMAEGEVPPMASLVPVYFATDRYPDELNSQELKAAFKNGCGDKVLSYGVAEVSIPPGHKKGQLERPKIWKFQFSEDVEKHVVMTRCEVKSLTDWQAAARVRLNETESNSALVFIHGYNTSFEEAMRRAAQIGWDMEFDGLIAAYSWGSAAEVSAYLADGESAKLTEPLLKHFLFMLREELKVDTLHVIAHSMGNRPLVEVLRNAPAKTGSGNLLKEVVMAAPDIDADDFKQAVASLRGKAYRYTLYGSSKDKALAMSKKIRKGYPRAGDGGNNVVVVGGIETVDASAVGEDMFDLGHDYIASQRILLADLNAVIRKSEPVAKRFGLKALSKGGLAYWLIEA